ncbi:MAG: hypothetical protein LBH43_04960 [Treponema sp.]|nr:hypothetical protein [Treponema sp.]
MEWIPPKQPKTPADRSYGLHIAMMAGLPEAALKRAYKLLEGIEKRGQGLSLRPAARQKRRSRHTQKPEAF